MILLDVNVLVYAHRADMPRHPECRQLFDSLLVGPHVFGVPEVVLAGVMRVVTLPIWNPPTSTDDALRFCMTVRSSRHCLIVQPTTNHWAVFEQLCRASGVRGKHVSDAYLAAFAVDRDDEWVTADKGFDRFPGLRWRHPWEAQARTNPR